MASVKNTNITIRVAPAQRDLIDRAARALGKSRIEFILDVATREAETTLLDQRLFLLEDAQWEAFTATLDAPAKSNAQLRKLMTTNAPWEANDGRAGHGPAQAPIPPAA